MKQKIVVQDLGLLSYDEAYQQQIRLQQKLLSWQENPKNFQHHFLIFCEHFPIVTLGKSGKKENLLLPEDQLKEKNIDFHWTNRGGDITYHAQGQLVVYPILDLHYLKKDLHWYLRCLEEICIQTLTNFGISAFRFEGKTGVWVGDKNQEKKMVAIGIHCKKWITLHGLAFNIDINLTPFNFIVPCNITDKAVTRLIDFNPEITMTQVKIKILEHFLTIFDLDLKG